MRNIYIKSLLLGLVTVALCTSSALASIDEDPDNTTIDTQWALNYEWDWTPSGVIGYDNSTITLTNWYAKVVIFCDNDTGTARYRIRLRVQCTANPCPDESTPAVEQIFNIIFLGNTWQGEKGVRTSVNHDGPRDDNYGFTLNYDPATQPTRLWLVGDHEVCSIPCDPGEEPNTDPLATECLPCDCGTWSPGNDETCTACPASTPLSKAGSDNETDCFACNAGREPSGNLCYCAYCPCATYSTDGTACVDCPADNISPTHSTSAGACFFCEYGALAGGCTCDTAITLVSFAAVPGSGSVKLVWETGDETDNVGFNIYRSVGRGGNYEQINPVMVPSTVGTGLGATYEYLDETAENRTTYSYMLEDFDAFGVATPHGPVEATPRLIHLLRQP
ncbi:hypothetical protein ACFL43_02480 [Thermodesulfobacteriota bacterium]